MKGIIARLEDSKIARWTVRVVITIIMVIAAAALFAAATAHADDTIVQIEDGNLVYYQKVKVIPNVPKGITDAEQARNLAEGKIPVISVPKWESIFYFGLPLIKKTDTFVSFSDGWIEDEKVGDESLSVSVLILLAFCSLLGFVMAYIGNVATVVFVVVADLLLTLLLGDKALAQAAATMAICFFVGYLPSLYLQRREKKR